MGDEGSIDWGFVVVKPPLEICFVEFGFGENRLEFQDEVYL